MVTTKVKLEDLQYKKQTEEDNDSRDILTFSSVRLQKDLDPTPPIMQPLE